MCFGLSLATFLAIEKDQIRLSRPSAAWRDRLPSGTWHRLTLGRRSHLEIHFQVDWTEADGEFSLTSLIIQAKGRAISARDLHDLRLKEVLARLQQQKLTRAMLQSGTRQVISPPRPGRRGHPPEFWEEKRAMYEKAKKMAPRRPIQWWIENDPTRPKDATVRSWIHKLNKLKAEEAGS